MPKEMFLCKDCIDKYKVNKTIDSALEAQKHRIKNLPGFEEKFKDLNQEMQAAQDKWLKRITPEEGSNQVMICGDCHKTTNIIGGTVIKDWHGFLDEIGKCLKDSRDYGKKRGLNIIPMTKYIAIKLALKAARMI